MNRFQGNGICIRYCIGGGGDFCGERLQCWQFAELRLRFENLQTTYQDKRQTTTPCNGQWLEMGRLFAQPKIRHTLLENVPRFTRTLRRYTFHNQFAQQSSGQKGMYKARLIWRRGRCAWLPPRLKFST